MKEKHYQEFHSTPKILGLGWFPNPTNPKEGMIILNGSYPYGTGATATKYEEDEYETHATIIMGYVLLHEIGHALGLPHASASCPDCVMAPVYNATVGWNGTFTGEDAARLVAMYGHPGAADSPAHAASDDPPPADHSEGPAIPLLQQTMGMHP